MDLLSQLENECFEMRVCLVGPPFLHLQARQHRAAERAEPRRRVRRDGLDARLDLADTSLCQADVEELCVVDRVHVPQVSTMPDRACALGEELGSTEVADVHRSRRAEEGGSEVEKGYAE